MRCDGGRNQRPWLLLGLTLLVLFLAGLAARWLQPPLAGDPLAMLGKGKQPRAMRTWLDGAARPGTLWVVLRGEGAQQAAQQQAEIWQRDGALDGVEIEAALAMLESDLAELISWAWLAAPEEDLAALEQELSTKEGTNLRLDRTLEDLQFGLAGQELIEGVRDPLRLREVPALEDRAALSQRLAETGSKEELGVVRLRTGSSERATEVVAWLDEKIPNSPVIGEMEYGVTGEAAFAREIEAMMRRDVKLSVFGTLGGMLLLFWWLDGRLRGLPVVVVPILAALVAAWLAVGLGFEWLYALGAGCAALLLGLVVDYAVVGRSEAMAGAGRWAGKAGIL